MAGDGYNSGPHLMGLLQSIRKKGEREMKRESAFAKCTTLLLVAGFLGNASFVRADIQNEPCSGCIAPHPPICHETSKIRKCWDENGYPSCRFCGVCSTCTFLGITYVTGCCFETQAQGRIYVMWLRMWACRGLNYVCYTEYMYQESPDRGDCEDVAKNCHPIWEFPSSNNPCPPKSQQ